jgi:hypothetical protein
MKAYVSTTIIQEIEVPEGSTQNDVLNFLALEQSFRDAFVGISDRDQQYRITDINVTTEDVIELGDECFDACH